VLGNAVVNKDLLVSGNIKVSHNSNIDGTLHVFGNTTLSGENSVISINNLLLVNANKKRNVFIDNSAFIQPYNGEPWQQHTTAAFLPNFTMQARAKATTDVVGIYGGHGVTVRKLQFTVNLPVNLGFNNVTHGNWIIDYGFQKKVNNVWNYVGWDRIQWIDPRHVVGYEGGDLIWTDTNIYTEVSVNPQLSVECAIGDKFRVRASYNHTTYGPYSLNAENQVKYSEEFTYYDYNENWADVDSTTPYNGSLVVSGGVGISANVNIGGSLQVLGNTISTSNLTGAFVVSGGIGVKGNSYFGENVTIDQTCTVNIVNALSDYRIKSNIINLPEILNVDNLRPVEYTNNLNNTRQYGFIAHEVANHIPHITKGEKDDAEYQSINYIGLIPLLVKEIQNAKKEIALLKSKLDLN
jgi:hypothetical protein